MSPSKILASGIKTPREHKFADELANDLSELRIMASRIRVKYGFEIRTLEHAVVTYGELLARLIEYEINDTVES